MADSDEDFPPFIVMLDYFCRKIRATSRVPRNLSTFNGRNRTLELLQGPDDQFVQVLRLNKECFYRLSSLLSENGLRDTRSISAHEQLMMFLTIVGHCDSNRRSRFEWQHSGETVSRHFHNVCAQLLALAPRLIGPPDFVHTASRIENNPNFFPYFRVRTWTKRIDTICH